MKTLNESGKTPMIKIPVVFVLALLLAFTSCSKEDEMETTSNPSPFNLLFVNNNAIDVSFTPTFTWEESTISNGGAITYDLYVQKSNEVPSGSLPSQLHKSGISTNTYTVTDMLMASTQYTWYVKANGGGGATNSTSVFTFTTAAVDNLPPGPFDLVSPFDGETDVPSDPVLSWQAASDPENDPVVYDVYLGENTPVRIGVGLQATTLSVGSLLPNTTYFWYVQAFDNAGNGRNSPLFSFTTGDGSSGGGNGSFNLIASNSITTQDGRFGHQMLRYNNKLWILGGTSISNNGGQSGELNDVWSSANNGQTWEQVKGYTEPPVGFHPSDEHQAVVFKNEMWVLNGNRNTANKSSDGITWENVGFAGNVNDGTHYSPRNQHQAVVFNGRLYVIGGLSGGIPQSDVWSTDGVPDGNGLITWERNVENAAFSPRYSHQVAVFNGRMYLVAGLTNGATRTNDVWSSADGVNWSLVTTNAPFTDRSEHVLVVSDNGSFLYLLGGEGLNPNNGSSIASLNDTWRMDSTNAWLEIEPHIDNVTDPSEYRGRKEFDAISVNGVIIVTMGKSGTTLLNDTWEFENL